MPLIPIQLTYFPFNKMMILILHRKFVLRQVKYRCMIIYNNKIIALTNKFNV